MDDTVDTGTALEIPPGLPIEEVQRIAFGLWCDKYSKSAIRVSRAIGVSERTVFRWQAEQGWEAKRRELLSQMLPTIRLETAIPLALAGHKAAQRLNAIMSAAVDQDLPPNLKEVQALTLAIDRAGFSPVGSKEMQSPVVHAEQDAYQIPSLAGKTVEELMRIEAEYRAKRT